MSAIAGDNSADRPPSRWRTALWLSLYLLAVVLLTLLTQIGGLVLVGATVIVLALRTPRRHRWLATTALFVALYAVASLTLVPAMATASGRVALPCARAPEASVSALSFLTCALNRHYATPTVASLLETMANDLERSLPNTRVRYLDAGFPFGWGMPMLLHLSHGDARKVDLAFFYKTFDGLYVPGLAPSPIGYWGFEQPRPSDSQPCVDTDGVSLRWDMAWLQPLWPDLALDEQRNAAMLNWLTGPGREHG
ncbi:MAG: hypothetical protein AAF563_24785, partial [Pseudomonadota bacterium]